MRYFVTGCAGFIGSNFVDRLLSDGHTVRGFDNLSTGRREFLENALSSDRFRLIETDLLGDQSRLTEAVEGSDVVIHLAANADVRFGPSQPTRDLHQNTIATVNLLEAMRQTGVPRIAFASTGSVYGEAQIIPTPEDSPIPVQTSLYAASKMSAECFLQAYSEAFAIEVYIYRFVSILGPRYSHGHVIDFYNQLCEHPERLRVLGDGSQRKSYLHVSDCVEGVLTVMERASDRVNVFNLGTDEYCEVNDSIGWICGEMGVNPQRLYTGGDRGWVGDNPFIWLECKRARALGWTPRHKIRESVIDTVRFLETSRAAAAR
jgi:UDP-glucose 4-epimerase